MTCDCHDHDCSTSTDVGGSSAFGRIEQALSDPRKLGYVALMSGGTRGMPCRTSYAHDLFAAC